MKTAPLGGLYTPAVKRVRKTFFHHLYNYATIAYTPVARDTLCLTTKFVTSNTIIETVRIPCPTVSITATDNGSLCGGVVYTAVSSSNCTYQWKVGNNTKTGETASTFSYSPNEGEVITCIATDKSNGCATTSNSIIENYSNRSGWSRVGGRNTFLSTLTDSYAQCVTSDKQGNVYAGGSLNDNGYNYVAKWDGSILSELGGSTFNGNIRSLTSDVKGNIYAIGDFKNASGKYYAAVWNGSAWGELGGTNSLTFVNPTSCITSDAKGNIYIGFDNGTYLAKWNGSSWTHLVGNNSATFNSNKFGRAIDCITSDAQGIIYVGGRYYNANGLIGHYVAKWDGSNWTDLTEIGNNNNFFKNVNDFIHCITTDAQGYVYVGGDYNYLAKWDGHIWTKLGGNNYTFNGHIDCITTDRQSNIYVGGSFTNANGRPYVANWNGNHWGELGGDNTSNLNDGIGNSICIDANDNVFIPGQGCEGRGILAEYKIVKSASVYGYNDYATINWQTTLNDHSTIYYVQRTNPDGSVEIIYTDYPDGSGSYSYTDILPLVDDNSAAYYYQIIGYNEDDNTYSFYSKVLGPCIPSDNTSYVALVTKNNKNIITPETISAKEMANTMVKVYPNPTRDKITVGGSNIVSILIVNNLGRVVKTVSYKDEINPTLSVSSLPVGVYHLRIQTTDGKVRSVGFVKE